MAMRNILRLSAFMMSWLPLAPAAAWDGVVTGKIIGLDAVADGENYGFRVYLDNGAAMCPAGAAWSFINRSASNYDAIVSLLTSSWLAGKSVTIYTNISASYCQIGYVTVRS